MMIPRNILLSFIVWTLEQFGFGLDLPDNPIAGPLDERDVFEQLQYGRD